MGQTHQAFVFLAAPEGLHFCKLWNMPHHSDMFVSPVTTTGLHRGGNQKRDMLLVDHCVLHTDHQETTWADDGAADGLATLGVCDAFYPHQRLCRYRNNVGAREQLCDDVWWQ